MRKCLSAIVVSLSLISGANVFAAPAKQFSTSEFEQTAKTSSLVVVGFHSPSCGSCKVQKPNLEAILKEKEFAEVHAFLADFDSSESFRKSLSRPVRAPSTIVIFKNGREVGRIQGVTNKDELRKTLSESL